MAALTPFHIAFPVDDLQAARRFYGEVLGCPEGRSASEWIDFDLYGHQIVAHLAPGRHRAAHANPVLRTAAVRFVIEPHTRFKGEVGEQSTMFFLDPAGNALEFKAFADRSQLFAR